ncbi:uncharacterized protein PHACADRAFT_202369 [Phanerochaete carnosa HHB-10118-sp]|uniref:Uncharacterized protein n=1 Tax=Phanerochaete carnosa (strain HHB-10118-sp) TaxID=650164 RepID=K5VCM3_PHACS|nr:uncharacterized protein PHACADRAFT_202369 [Phanerochaete carnosa HHB-10118-sp]EKM48808.1 hypothetical protein PHACADRAFT_202369 [Phanerochaete carnosa HHB-10118-sp]
MSSLLYRIGSWIMGEPSPGPSGPHNPSLFDIQHVRRLLRHFVPTELADMILHHAAYYHVRTACTTAPLSVCDSRTHHADVPVLSIELTRLADTAALDNVLRVEALVRGHDQGWSGYPEDKGTERNAWTWYSIGSADSATHEERLATNLHAVPQVQTHGPFVWERDSEVVGLLKTERVLELWAHARYPGWTNHVEYAEMSIICFPS